MIPLKTTEATILYTDSDSVASDLLRMAFDVGEALAQHQFSSVVFQIFKLLKRKFSEFS